MKMEDISRARWKVSVDLGGCRREEVKIEKDGKKIKVSGHRAKEAEEYEFTRSFTLPDNVDVQLIQWKFDGDQVIITAK
jgi:HSP20 family molecular chaperone IbpA